MASLEGWSFTIKLHPRSLMSAQQPYQAPRSVQNWPGPQCPVELPSNGPESARRLESGTLPGPWSLFRASQPRRIAGKPARTSNSGRWPGLNAPRAPLGPADSPRPGTMAREVCLTPRRAPSTGRRCANPRLCCSGGRVRLLHATSAGIPGTQRVGDAAGIQRSGRVERWELLPT